MPESLCWSRREISLPRPPPPYSGLSAAGKSGSGRRLSRSVLKQLRPRLSPPKSARHLSQSPSLYGCRLLRPGGALPRPKKLSLQRNLPHLRPICRQDLFLFPLPGSGKRRLEDVKVNRNLSRSPKINRRRSTRFSGNGSRRSRRKLLPLERCPKYLLRECRSPSKARTMIAA